MKSQIHRKKLNKKNFLQVKQRIVERTTDEKSSYSNGWSSSLLVSFQCEGFMKTQKFESDTNQIRWMSSFDCNINASKGKKHRSLAH